MSVYSPPVPSRAAANRAAPSWAMPALMSSCVVVVVAMVAAINLALPKLSGSDLHPSSTQLLWIVEAYILVFGGLLIPAGALGDRVGRKGVLLAGLGTFATGCLVSAAAPTQPDYCPTASRGSGDGIAMEIFPRTVPASSWRIASDAWSSM
jgi:MFS family permease